MNNIKLSICIPVYNTKKELFKECLNSITTCGFEDKKNQLEIIVIDDGSDKINVKAIVDEFYEKNQGYKNIKCFRNFKNEGLLEARRAAVLCSKGYYIYNLDSDDYLEKDLLGKIIDEYFDYDIDMIQTEYNDIIDNPNLKHKPLNEFNAELKFGDKGNLLKCIMLDNTIPGYVWGKLIKRRLYLNTFKEIPYLNLVYNEDFLQTFFLCKNAKSITTLTDYHTYNYRRQTGMTNISTLNMSKEKFIQYCTYSEIMKIINPEFAKSDELKHWIKMRHTHKLLEIYSSIIVGAKDEDLKEFIEIFKDHFGEETLEEIHDIFEKMK